MPKTTQCQLSGEAFEVSDQEMGLLKKMGLKKPIYSPKIRSAMRMAFRNERNLYIRKCDFSGENIISMYHEKQPFPVYKYDYWISDKWEIPYLEYDPDKNFFQQYAELQKITPHANAFIPYNENCDYVSAAEKNKNCYMIFVTDRCQDCYYLHTSFNSRDCLDSAYLIDSELCYECTDCRGLYHCRMCFLCDNSSELSFCFDMRGCSDCFFCYGLRNKKYCVNNKQYTKEEYEKMMSDIDMGSSRQFEALKRKYLQEIVARQDYKRMINTENCTGNFLINCKNCEHCYDLENAEDCRNFRVGSNRVKDIMDSHAIVDNSELIYGNVSTTESYNCHNVIGCWTTKDSFYSEFLQGCSDCIGCVSLRHKKHSILNKQYAKDEYEKIKKHIIESLGDYYGSPFPIKLAPFTYMESAFRDYETLAKEDLKKIGWAYGEERQVTRGKYRPASDIPDNISSVDSNNIDGVFLCGTSKKPFKIIPQEIRLLKKIIAPLPKKHYDVRFEERVKYRKIDSSQAEHNK